MEEQTLVSIITVTYNSSRTLDDTIKSVLSQDYPNIEYILIDGNSKDNTVDIIKKYQQSYPLKYISEPDKGIYDAMNKGIKISSGKIIGILNSDDRFMSNNIITQVVQPFVNDDTIDAVYGNILFFRDNPDIISRKWVTKSYFEKFFDKGNVPPHPSLFIKKQVYNEIGAYYPAFKITSDYEFMLRAFKVHKYKPFFLNMFIVNMRMGGESTKSFSNILIANKEIVKAWKMNSLRPPLFFWPLRLFKKVWQYINRG